MSPIDNSDADAQRCGLFEKGVGGVKGVEGRGMRYEVQNTNKFLQVK